MPPIAKSFFNLSSEAVSETETTAMKMTEISEADTTEDERASGYTRECDFDKDPSELYLQLQKKDWEGAIARSVTDPVEACTWVVRKEFDGKLRWRLLPLHAAIIFKAPEEVIEALLGAYPRGAECKDDQGMLPLHLAFRNGSAEEVVNLLLVAYPQSIDVKDRKGRIPLVLAQASTSPNRDAFMRALERGPTYYAVAAAATERAAVTAELRAIFDAKLMEIKNQHQDEIDALKEDAMYRQQELEDKVMELEMELNKTQETSQILVDHVNSLEAQLTSRSDTERFLATKIATLDTSLRDVSRVKEETESFLHTENRELKETNQRLCANLQARDAVVATLTAKVAVLESDNQELATGLNIAKEKSLDEIQRLEMEWATSRASAAVLEAQLKKKIETEHSLACQVSTLAARLAESAYDSSSTTVAYSAKIESLMNERIALRTTVGELTKKLTFVASELLKVSHEQDQIIQAADAHEKSMTAATGAHTQIMENAEQHEMIIEKINEERRKILDVLIAQEQEILESAAEREKLRELIKLQSQQQIESTKERENLVFRVKQQKVDVRKIVEEDLAMIPTSFSAETDGADLIDEVVRRTTEQKEKDANNQRSPVGMTDNMKYAEKEASLKEDAEKRVAVAMESVLLEAKKKSLTREGKKKKQQQPQESDVTHIVTSSALEMKEDEKKDDDEQQGVEVAISVDRVEVARTDLIEA